VRHHGRMAAYEGRPAPPREFETPFEHGTSYEGDRLLARSRNFTVRGCYELVILQGRELRRAITIGDFYSNPSAAALNGDESWCVMVGYGLVGYRLSPPWREYEYGYGSVDANDQWWEFGRDPHNELWLTSVRGLDGSRFVATTESDTDWSVSEYLVDAEHESVVPTRRWVDNARRLRTEHLASYEGLALTSVLGEGERLRLSFGGDGGRELLVAGSLTAIPGVVPQPAPRTERLAGASAPLVDALTQLIGKTLTTARSGRDGSLELGFDGSSSVGPGRSQVRVVAGEDPGSWTASGPAGSLVSPGSGGWTEVSPGA
jgi:hypothetical protein